MNQSAPTLPSRRDWSKGLLALCAVPWLAWCGTLSRWRAAQGRSSHASLPRPTADGVQLHEDVILIRDGVGLRAFSARCPHLGCRLRTDGGSLICPCHGSRFDENGLRLAGPAAHDLRPLAIEADPDPQRVRVALD